jgi:hypothetical protein
MTNARVAGHRHPVGRTWFALEIAYVVLVAAMAAAGMTTETHRILLVVAGLLALPCGIGAIVGLYVLTGLFNWVAAGFSTYSISQGTGGCNPSGHCWSTTTGTPVGAQGFLFSACVVLLFVGTAVTNVLILRSVVRGRSGHHPARPNVAEPHR